MSISVKGSPSFRYAVLGAAGVLFVCFWLMRSQLTPAQLPAMPRLARHDTLQAKQIVTSAQIETVPTATPATQETPVSRTAPAAAPMAVPANLAPPVEVAPEQPVAPPAITVAEDDRAFFEKAGQSGIQQDKLSHGVLNQLVYPEVREYAYALMDEQAAINAEILLLAARKQVVVPMPERVAFRKWTRAEGSVDQHYVNLLVDANAEEVALYERAAQSSDPEIASFARKTLPVVQRRLSAVRALKKITD